MCIYLICFSKKIKHIEGYTPKCYPYHKRQNGGTNFILKICIICIATTNIFEIQMAKLKKRNYFHLF